MSELNKAASAARKGPSLEDLCPLGRWLEENRTASRLTLWKRLMFCFLALLVVLNVIISNHHPHFGVDSVPGFWPAFSFVMGVAMIFFVKKIVQPLIKRPENHYGDL